MRLRTRRDSLRRRTLLSEALLWYAVMGGPITWAAMHVVGWGSTEAACYTAGWDIGLRAWSIGLTVGGAVLVVGALLAAAVMFAATRGAGSDPPLGRMHFMATMALAISVIFLFLVLLDGLGATVIGRC